jgi:FtsH-binding integral membrane protein
MAIGPERNYMTRAQAGAADIDVGLRQYMLKVYDYMAGGLVLTGLVAFAAVNIPAVYEILFPLRFVALFATFGIALFMGFRINTMRASTAQALFWIYAALMGIWISPILLMYTGASIAKTFFITAGTFAAMSLYGYTTKRDLSQFGSFLVMGLFGLILAIVVNLFLRSPAVDFAISILGVLIFTGLTAWDTQRIKEWYYEHDAAEVMTKKAIQSALQLYLDFLNLFLFLLRFLGVARSN